MGPGTYNDHESFLKLKKMPCPAIIKKVTGIPEDENGKTCYIMVGQSIIYEPRHLESQSQIRDLEYFNS